MNEYAFVPYLKNRISNSYAKDTALQKILDHYCKKAHRISRKELQDLSDYVYHDMFALSHAASLTENEPKLYSWDAHHQRLDYVEICPQTQKIHRDLFSKKLGFVSSHPIIHYAKLYLVAQNGEAGVCCALACTDGLERILRRFKSGSDHLKEAHDRLIHPTIARYYHGAQFVTEIQGGSDPASNVLKAVKGNDHWKLYGEKWFCSNIIADYFLVTARVEGAPKGGKGLSLFLVPHHQNDSVTNNHFRIERLKDKFGTRELPTAEVNFDGSYGYLVGEENRGLSLVVGTVLVTSRIHCSFSAAALLRRTLNEIEAYSSFREAFGKKIKQFSLVEDMISKIKITQHQLLCGFFEVLHRWETANQNPNDKTSMIQARILISLFKPYATQLASFYIHEAMMLLGGNGMEEQFSILPRLLRDSIVYETWEGPHFVLLTQAYEDLLKFNISNQLDGFFKDLLGSKDHPLKSTLADILKRKDQDGAHIEFKNFSTSFMDAFSERQVRLLLTSKSKIV